MLQVNSGFVAELPGSCNSPFENMFIFIFQTALRAVQIILFGNVKTGN